MAVAFLCIFHLLLKILGKNIYFYFFLFSFDSTNILSSLNSNVRNVPDNQEVFADVNTDQSIIVEILEFVKQVANEDAAKYE